MDRFGRLNRSRGDLTKRKKKCRKRLNAPILKAYEWVRVQILFTKGVKGKSNCVKGCCMALRGDSTLDLGPYVPY